MNDLLNKSDPFDLQTSPPLSLYVHIPWCVRKCPYCDFNSHAAVGDIPMQAYVDALLADLEQDLPKIWGRTVTTVFIGGGTPSLFSVEAIGRLLEGIRARLNCKPGMEITMEANPGTLEIGRFAEFRDAGVNRLSIGVQSFNDEMLQRLGRIHGRAEAIQAAEQAHYAGFDSFNLDLMHGLPGQNSLQALDDLQTAIDLQPAHISWYQLTLEPNTAFYQHPPVLPVEDMVDAMQEQGRDRLAQYQYARYEVSAYAKEGYQCQHNLNYWRFGDYLGIGAGAHGKITDLATQTVARYWKQRHPQAYMEADPVYLAGNRVLDVPDVRLEYMMNALRLTEGVSVAEFVRDTGLSVNDLRTYRQQAIDKGLLEVDEEVLRATSLGQRFLDDLVAMFM
ncbi:MAG: radical SAM family heme chaperone HemW [Gammaproteobacteria bacterium]|nr:radical SAM family heme chaperone HemW [Gammaproteobacteria bacterium]